jgi:Zn-dependent protease
MNLELDIFTLVVTLVTIIIGISLHEMMHAYTGLKLGDTTAHEEGRVSINPLRHIDPFMTVLLPIITLISFGAPILAAKPVPFNPDRVRFDEFGAALIAAAGPFTNLILAVVGAGIAHVVSADPSVYSALSIFVGLNLSIFVFNLIPIPPLDGSRVLYAFAPDFLRDIMAQMEQYGIFLVFGLVLLVPGFSAVISNLSSSLYSFLLY